MPESFPLPSQASRRPKTLRTLKSIRVENNSSKYIYLLYHPSEPMAYSESATKMGVHSTLRAFRGSVLSACLGDVLLRSSLRYAENLSTATSLAGANKSTLGCDPSQTSQGPTNPCLSLSRSPRRPREGRKLYPRQGLSHALNILYPSPLGGSNS
jgi:hypothetical protein